MVVSRRVPAVALSSSVSDSPEAARAIIMLQCHEEVLLPEQSRLHEYIDLLDAFLQNYVFCDWVESSPGN